MASKACRLEPLELHVIGRIKNERSRHTYVQGMHRLERTWDQLEYPVGPPQTRMEVEVKSKLAERYLAQAEEELRALFEDDLEAPPCGKSFAHACHRPTVAP